LIATIALVASRALRSQPGRLALLGVLCVLLGAAAFSATQGVGYGTGLYWAITTATTVGYGDVTPRNTAGRVAASAVMLTTIPLFASSFASFAGAVATARLRRLFGMEAHVPSGKEVVVFGTHPVVPVVVADLLGAGREVVVVTRGDRSLLPEAARHIAADPTTEEGVKRGRPERAGQILVAGEDDAAVLVTAVLVHRVAPATPALAIASSPRVSEALRELGIDAVAGDELLGHTVAKCLEAPHAGELLLRILDSEGFRLVERPVGTGAGSRLSSLRNSVRGVVIGAVCEGRVMMGVVDDPLLQDGDRLLVLEPGRKRQVAGLSHSS
jgi:voltage-gated potassium channel